VNDILWPFFEEFNKEDKKLNVFSTEQCTNKHVALYRLFLSANRLTRIQRSSLPSPDVSVCNVLLGGGNLRQKFNRSNPRTAKAPQFHIRNIIPEITESELECVSQSALTVSGHCRTRLSAASAISGK
jgi:hypothetical protein